MTGKRGPVTGTNYGRTPGPKGDPDRPRRATRSVEPLPVHRIDPPPPPAELGIVGKAIWRDLWQGLPILSPLIDGFSVQRYCQAADDAAAARAVISERGLVLDEALADPRGGVIGSRAALNPAVMALKNAERTLSELAGTLGLTPASRARLGLTISLAELASAEAGRVLNTMFLPPVIDAKAKRR